MKPREHNLTHGRDEEDPTSEGLDPSVELLIEIARHPVAARYVRVLDLRSLMDFDEPQSSQIRDAEELRLVEDMIRQSSFLRKVDCDTERWLDFLQTDNNGNSEGGSRSMFCTILLLTLLPNLQSLGLSDNWPRRSDHPDLSNLIDALVSQANSAIRDENLALGKLTTLTPFVGFGYDYKQPLHSIEPFLALHSLHECFGASYIALEDGYTGEEFIPTLPQLGTNLTTLELWESVFGRHEMKRLLADMNHLKRLCISLTTKWHGCGFDCNAGGIVGSIMESPVAETLTHLTLLCSSPWNQCFTGVDSLKDFKVLERLVIHAAFFHGAPYTLHKDFNDEAEMYAENGNPVDQATARLDMLLPATLQSFELLLEYPVDHVQTLKMMLDGLELGTLRATNRSLHKIVFRALKKEFEELDKSVDPWPVICSTATAISAQWELLDADSSLECQELADFMDRFDIESM